MFDKYYHGKNRNILLHCIVLVIRLPLAWSNKSILPARLMVPNDINHQNLTI